VAVFAVTFLIFEDLPAKKELSDQIEAASSSRFSRLSSVDALLWIFGISDRVADYNPCLCRVCMGFLLVSRAALLEHSNWPA